MEQPADLTRCADRAHPLPADGAELRRIVVVSQDSVVRDLSEVILKNHGFIVDQAETLPDVRELVATKPVFACIIDCRRLTGRGTELLRQLADVGLVHTVALIEADDGESWAAALGSGATVAVECPFENRDLVAAIENLPELGAGAERRGPS